MNNDPAVGYDAELVAQEEQDKMTPKNTRIAIYITKSQHIELLRSVSAQLGSSNLKDGLEHILNCRLAGDSPAGSNATQSTAMETDVTREFG